MSPVREGFTNFYSSSLPGSHEAEMRGKVHSDPANHLNTVLTNGEPFPKHPYTQDDSELQKMSIREWLVSGAKHSLCVSLYSPQIPHSTLPTPDM